MKFPSTLCILSLGLSLIVLADAHKQHYDAKFRDSNKIQGHEKPNNQHHHHNAQHKAADAIPNIPYRGHEGTVVTARQRSWTRLFSDIRRNP